MHIESYTNFEGVLALCAEVIHSSFVAAIRCKYGAEAMHKTFTELYAAIRQPLSISNSIEQPFDKLRVTDISSLTNFVLSG